MSNFPVGKLESLWSKEFPFAIAEFLSWGCFGKYNDECKSRLEKILASLPIFEKRTHDAINGILSWEDLSLEPQLQLLLDDFWQISSVVKACEKTEAEKEEENMKREVQAIYYCIYVYLLWTLDKEQKRYKDKIITMEQFVQQYLHNPKVEASKMTEKEWEELFQFRNVLTLANAVCPFKGQKGLLCRVAGILADGKIPSTGGGQSKAVTRKQQVYEFEGHVFVKSSKRRRFGDVDNRSQKMPLLKMESTSYEGFNFANNSGTLSNDSISEFEMDAVQFLLAMSSMQTSSIVDVASE